MIVSNREIICYSLNYLFLVTRLISSTPKNTQKIIATLGIESSRVAFSLQFEGLSNLFGENKKKNPP